METVEKLVALNSFPFIAAIAGQLVVVYFIALSIRFNRFFQRDAFLKKTELQGVWMAQITDQVLDLSPYKVQSPKNRRKRLWLQETLIEMALTLSGPPFKELQKIYSQLGFLSQDHHDLSSFSFARKLKAFGNLSVIQDSSSVSFVKPFLESRNYYLRFAALRFLARKDFSSIANFEKEIKNFHKQKRYDTLYEILTILALYQRDYFMNQFLKNNNFEVKRIFLKVIAALKLTEPIALVRDSLKMALQDAKLDMGLIKLHLLCLSLVPDPETQHFFEQLSSHPIEEVRYLSLCSLFIQRPDLKETIIASISQVDKVGLENAFQSFSLNLGKEIYG